jgi:hypothetical protein
MVILWLYNLFLFLFYYFSIYKMDSLDFVLLSSVMNPRVLLVLAIILIIAVVGYVIYRMTKKKESWSTYWNPYRGYGGSSYGGYSIPVPISKPRTSGLSIKGKNEWM